MRTLMFSMQHELDIRGEIFKLKENGRIMVNNCGSLKYSWAGNILEHMYGIYSMYALPYCSNTNTYMD